jgi:hypothetical protein
VIARRPLRNCLDFLSAFTNVQTSQYGVLAGTEEILRRDQRVAVRVAQDTVTRALLLSRGGVREAPVKVVDCGFDVCVRGGKAKGGDAFGVDS